MPVIDFVGPQLEAIIGPLQMRIGTIITGMAIAVLLGIVVGLFPSIGANRLQIVDALRK